MADVTEVRMSGGVRLLTARGRQTRGASFFRIARIGAFVLIAVSLLLSPGCALRESVRRVCVDFEASEDLNAYDGRPQTLTLFVYALSDAKAFEAVDFSELMAGHLPEGVLEPPVAMTIQPEMKLRIEEIVPRATRSVGIVADYDRAPASALPEDGEGAGLRVVIPARCGFFTPSLKLSETQIEGS